MTFRPGILSRGAFAAVLVAAACLAGPVAGTSAQAPETTIDSGPPAVSDDTTPEFVFSGTGAEHFECRHHRTFEPQPGLADCQSPLTLGPLADGPYTFEVQAVDAAGVPDPSPATLNFRVEAAFPDTTIISVPPELSNDTTPTFAFASTEDGTFECSHHPPGATPVFDECQSPHTLPPLADGTWVFEVAAIDTANKRDEPATDIFAIDATAPSTTIDSGPSGVTNDSTPVFAFSSPDSTVSFECWHHRPGETVAAFTGCSSATPLPPLGEGDWVFEVRTIDALGNRGAPATRSFHVDTNPPQTTITGGPGDTTAATAVFLFSAPGAARFSCRLDGGAWQPCDSPHTYPTLSLGGHRFEVTAVDAAGNEDPTPAEHAWQVLKPGLVIPAAVKQATALAKELIQMRKALARIRLRTLARRRTLTFNTFNALTAGTVGVRARTRVRRGGARRWITVIAGKRKVPGAGRRPVRTRVTKKGRSLARSRRRLPLELRLSFTDLAGRSLWATSKVTLRR